jgi:two-component system CheB/CheR fusion protein
VAKRAPGKSVPEKRSQEFPIVGIGASAGGLEAIQALVRKLPADTGMAFVVVQHLQPGHPSILPELLGKSSRMPFIQAEDGMAVEPNHVYVIPPGAALTISGRILRVGPREHGPAQHMTIDGFFRSLAADLKSRAIGVVLSGSSNDGALGIRAIKGEGGITFAQKPESAAYDVMPRSAAATGAVDFVLAPEAMAKELAQIARHPYVRLPEPNAPGPQPEPDAAALRRIFALLERSTGVDFTIYRRAAAARRIERRMALEHIDKLEDYARFLAGHPQEVQALHDELLGNGAGFFSDPELLEYLKNAVFPRFAAGADAGEAVRMWVPGCATGEEAYSFAIAFLEFLHEQNVVVDFQLFATDASKTAIERARAGVYPEAIESEVSPDRLRRFFLKHEDGYHVSKAVREHVVFARHNVAKDPPFSKIDLIGCRSLLHYLAPAARKRAIEAFHYALKPGGFLAPGKAENLGEFATLFEPVDDGRRVYTGTGAQARMGTEKVAEGGQAQAGRARGFPELETAAGARVLQREADQAVLSRYAPPGVVVDERFDVVQFRGEVSAFVRPAPGEASLNLLKTLREGLAMDVRSALEA